MAAEQSDVVRANLNDLKMADVDKNSLIDFYRALPEGSEDLNLGMYYISYLNDACEKVNVRFESSANHFKDTNLTIRMGHPKSLKESLARRSLEDQTKRPAQVPHLFRRDEGAFQGDVALERLLCRGLPARFGGGHLIGLGGNGVRTNLLP